jgi:beta-1,2-mannobiose phosphorylase / 1,2-beta-oligomannan phosphorylase
MSLLVLYIVIVLGLFVTGLFVWGTFQILFTPWRTRIRYPFKTNPFSFQRHDSNPLLQPSHHDFEGQAVMNPAAVFDGERTHLFYRAVGNDGVSRIGYASSKDGKTIDERLPYPVFALEGADPHLAAARREHAEKNHPDLVASGGSWAGTEDPRAVIIADRLYLSFSAFHSWNSVRIAVSSISLPDLKLRKWNWSKPTFLSPANQVHKNWVLFPEKINGNFAVLTSVSPNVEITYRKNLESVGVTEPAIEAKQGPRTQGRSGYWDNWVRGAGPSPLKTAFGWLLFYHATDRNGYGHEYQVGAMLLDKNDPTKVIARAPAPVLSPDAHYETHGAKPNIVYACGATTEGDKLTLYYGAADNVVCAASTSLSEFLRKLLRHEATPFTPIAI